MKLRLYILFRSLTLSLSLPQTDILLRWFTSSHTASEGLIDYIHDCGVLETSLNVIFSCAFQVNVTLNKNSACT